MKTRASFNVIKAVVHEIQMGAQNAKSKAKERQKKRASNENKSNLQTRQHKEQTSTSQGLKQPHAAGRRDREKQETRGRTNKERQENTDLNIQRVIN